MIGLSLFLIFWSLGWAYTCFLITKFSDGSDLDSDARGAFYSVIAWPAFAGILSYRAFFENGGKNDPN